MASSSNPGPEMPRPVVCVLAAPWTVVPPGLLVGSGRRAEPGWRVPWPGMCLQAQGSELGLRPEWESEALFAVK